MRKSVNCTLRVVSILKNSRVYAVEALAKRGINAVNSRKNRGIVKACRKISLPEDQWYYEIEMLVSLIEGGNRELFRQNLELSCLMAETLERARKSAGMCF